MKLRIWSIASTLVVGASVLAGCAGEDAEAGEATYPPIGYTPPPSAPAETEAPAPAPSAPAPNEAPGAWAAASQWASPQDDGEGEPAQDPNAPPGNPASAEQAPPGAAPNGAPGYADTDPSALTDFRGALDPYGSWVDDPTYGTVWVPSSSVVGDDFTPYVSAGHWAYDSDYTWVSDYDWGWAPFHYGRWVYSQGPGWAWVPGRAYAGAWVSWRAGYDDWSYVGWAPLAPTWGWRGGTAVGLGFVPRAPYSFVSNGQLFGPEIGSRVIGGAQVGVIAAHTRPFAPAGTARIAANPSVGGPSPGMLHISPDSVERTPANNRGLMQARAYAHPSTAVALGARAPRGFSGYAQSRAPYPAYRGYAPSHFGGRLGAGFAGNPAAAAPMRSYGEGSVRLNGGGGRAYYGSRTLGGDARVAPVYRNAPATYRSGGPGPYVHGPAGPPARGGEAGGGFRGGGSFHSYGGGGFRGGGGGHGGGRR